MQTESARSSLMPQQINPSGHASSSSQGIRQMSWRRFRRSTQVSPFSPPIHWSSSLHTGALLNPLPQSLISRSEPGIISRQSPISQRNPSSQLISAHNAAFDQTRVRRLRGCCRTIGSLGTHASIRCPSRRKPSRQKYPGGHGPSSQFGAQKRGKLPL